MNATEVAIPHPFESFTSNQIKFISVGSKFPAILSLWGSFFIIYDIIGSHRGRQDLSNNAYYRIMLGLSVSDCIVSIFGWFLSSWILPKSYLQDDTVWGNVGNLGTCEAQGFLVHVGGVCSAFYTAFLTFYYLLCVKYDWKEPDIRKIEPYFHFGIWGFALISASILLAQDFFNPELPFCYIQSYPFGCEFSDEYECIRGDNLVIYQLILFFVPVGVAFALLTGSMYALIMHTREQERRVLRFSIIPNTNTNENRRLTKLVFKKAMKYVGAYLIVWFPSALYLASILVIKTTAFQRPAFIFTVLIIMEILSPLQGLFNALIYTKSNLYSFAKKTISLLRVSFESVPKTSNGETQSTELPKTSNGEAKSSEL